MAARPLIAQQGTSQIAGRVNQVTVGYVRELTTSLAVHADVVYSKN